MHARQAQVLSYVSTVVEKLAARKPVALGGMPVLWKYVCPETSNEFYLTSKRLTVKSPYTGKSFTSKPEKLTPQGVAKDMKEEAKADKADAGAPGPKSAAPKKKKKASDEWKVGDEG